MNSEIVEKIKQSFIKDCEQDKLKPTNIRLNIYLILQTSLSNVDNWTDEELQTFSDIQNANFRGEPPIHFKD